MVRADSRFDPVSNSANQCHPAEFGAHRTDGDCTVVRADAPHCCMAWRLGSCRMSITANCSVSNAFTYGVIAYFAATIFQQFLHRSLALTFFLTVCFTFVEKWMTYGLTRLFDVTAYRADAVLRQSLQEMIVNGVFLLLLYPLLVSCLNNDPNAISAARWRRGIRRQRLVHALLFPLIKVVVRLSEKGKNWNETYV